MTPAEQEMPVYDGTNFQECYEASVASPMHIIRGQFKQLTWAKKRVKVHDRADKPSCEIVGHDSARNFKEAKSFATSLIAGSPGASTRGRHLPTCSQPSHSLQLMRLHGFGRSGTA
eukprot:jgi/Tetstr1/442686/TSEL_030778.t1